MTNDNTSRVESWKLKKEEFRVSLISDCMQLRYNGLYTVDLISIRVPSKHKLHLKGT